MRSGPPRVAPLASFVFVIVAGNVAGAEESLCRNRDHDPARDEHTTPPHQHPLSYVPCSRKSLSVRVRRRDARLTAMRFRPMSSSSSRSIRYGWTPVRWNYR